MARFMDDEPRIQRIADLAGVTFDEADETINEDWPNADEHVEWLKVSSDEEIASWVDCLVNQ